MISTYSGLNNPDTSHSYGGDFQPPSESRAPLVRAQGSFLQSQQARVDAQDVRPSQAEIGRVDEKQSRVPGEILGQILLELTRGVRECMLEGGVACTHIWGYHTTMNTDSAVYFSQSSNLGGSPVTHRRTYYGPLLSNLHTSCSSTFTEPRLNLKGTLQPDLGRKLVLDLGSVRTELNSMTLNVAFLPSPS